MAARRGFEVDATENAAAFTDENLANYDVVIFLCTTGDVLNAAQQGAFERYIQAGGGYAGIHSASDTEYDWPWYGGLVGAYFRDHPGSVNPQYQVATMNVEDRHTAATRRLGRTWTREEEWYNFRTNPRDDVHVLLSVDESTYDPRGYSVPGGSPGMGDHPISWCQPYDGGRAFYTALGHKGVYWEEPLMLSHVFGGIEMAAGAKPFNCGTEDD
jgi:type 1 glutamine amidotransferase